MAFNTLLSLMPAEIRQELVELGADLEIRSGDRVPQEWLDGSHVFIVTGGIASKFQRSAQGRISEVGMVGREGMFPVSALLGVAAAPHIVLSQAGTLQLLKLRTKDFQRIVRESFEAKLLVRKFVYAFITQIASNILSSEQNDVSVRTARWLLMCHDRVDGDVVEVTHDALAQITFAYRPTITKTLASFAEAGLIQGGRGRVTIRDRDGLCKIADGSYGLSERYWQEHIGPFGKDQLTKFPRRVEQTEEEGFGQPPQPDFAAARKMAPRA